MKKLCILYISIFVVLTTTCKKRPDAINILVKDPLLDQPIADAKVALIEQDLNGELFNAGINCKIVETVETNSEGEAVIYDAKFKTGKSVNYFLTVIEAYNKELFFSCANRKTEDFLLKTNKDIDKLVYAYADKIDWQVVFRKLSTNNFGSNSQDSVSVKIYRDFNSYSGFDDNLNGSKDLVKEIFLTKAIYQSLSNPSNPENYSCCIYNSIDDKVFPGNYRIEVVKKKGGLTTTYSYSEVVPPFSDKHYFNLEW